MAGGSELVGQQRHEYDAEQRAIAICAPLKEVGGRLYKGGRRIDIAGACDTGAGAGARPGPARPATPRRRKAKKKGRTKTPAGTRSVELPPSIAVFYEELMDSHRYPFVFSTPEGNPLRRSNFRARFWRPVWDGTQTGMVVPPIRPGLTFHEGRHSHSTWLAEDGIPEVARRARLGQKMKGMGRIYDHVTPEMRHQILQALETRWCSSVTALLPNERTASSASKGDLAVKGDHAGSGTDRTVGVRGARPPGSARTTSTGKGRPEGDAPEQHKPEWCAILGLNQ
ncbi:integrase [Amycolatopsis sp. NPDC058986]|uniref:integrase n=1 Tax=Amycolatopsis sp. NPDC058986 TaxID=3346685 RepID=UPI003671CB8C